MAILLISESPLLLERELEKIRGDSEPEFFEGKETTARQIIEGGESGSLFVKKRLVVIKRTGEMKKEEIEGLEAHFQRIKGKEAWAQYLLMTNKCDRRQKVWQSLLELCDCRELKTPSRNALPRWVMEEGRRQRLEVSPEAANLMIEFVGDDLGILSQTLARLELSSTDSKKIGRTEVESLVTDFSPRSVFDLTEAIGRKECSVCFGTLSKGFSGRESFPLVVSMMTRHFRILQNLQEAHGDSVGEVGRLFRIPPFFMQNYQDQARRFSKKKCREILKSLFQTDLIFKRSSLPAEILLQDFIRRALQ